jgi:hypothetical protein
MSSLLPRLLAERSRIQHEIDVLAQTLSAQWELLGSGWDSRHDQYNFQLERLTLQQAHLFVIEQAIKRQNEQNYTNTR